MTGLATLKARADERYGTFSQLAQFCLVGASGMAIDLACYAGSMAAGVPLAPARALAIAIAMSWNFWLNRRLTFAQPRVAAGRAGRRVLRQYLRFCATCSLGAILSWLVSVGLPTLVPAFGEMLLLAAVAGIVVGTSSNFFISKHWVFAHRAEADG